MERRWGEVCGIGMTRVIFREKDDEGEEKERTHSERCLFVPMQCPIRKGKEGWPFHGHGKVPRILLLSLSSKIIRFSLGGIGLKVILCLGTKVFANADR